MASLHDNKNVPIVPPQAEINYVELSHELRRAMKGIGTDDDTLIKHIGRLNYLQLQRLVESYRINVKRDLLNDIHDETSHNYRIALESLLTERSHLDAQYLHGSMQGIGTNDDILVEVLCTRTPEELKNVFIAYQQLFKKDLLQDLHSKLGGDFGKLLQILATSPRSVMPHRDQLERDAKSLYDAGEGKIGTDEQVFIHILGSNPRPYVEELSLAYCKLYGKNLTCRYRFRNKFCFQAGTHRSRDATS